MSNLKRNKPTKSETQIQCKHRNKHSHGESLRNETAWNKNFKCTQVSVSVS